MERMVISSFSPSLLNSANFGGTSKAKKRRGTFLDLDYVRFRADVCCLIFLGLSFSFI